MTAEPRVKVGQILPLQDFATASNVQGAVGGKGAGLLRLLQAGFTVPDAWVLPADAPVPDSAALADFWQQFQRRWPGGRLAVRSSALAEDTQGASFAGVYSTVLDVDSAQALCRAVDDVLTAGQSAAALVYRERAGLAGERGFAIVLQRMVSARSAGVLMTANPLRPLARDELVVEAAWGLGEAVVSGRTEPDRLVMRMSDGVILQRTMGAKELEIVWQPGAGHVQREVETERRCSWALSEADVGALCALARQVEQRVGPRQDLEFAIEGDGCVQALQLRPMTALPPERPRSVWSRRFGDEYLADYTMPLSYTLLGVWIRDVFMYDFAERFGFRGRLTEPPIQRHEGYAYASGQYVVELLAAVPRALRTTEAIDWFPEQWNEQIQAAPWRPTQLARMLAAVWRDPASSLQENPRYLAEHTANIEANLLPKLGQNYAALSAEQWRHQLDAVEALGRRHFEILRWGMGFHSPLLHSMLQKALEAWSADSARELYADLIGGLETHTAKLNRDLWSLAQCARGDVSLSAALSGELLVYDQLRRQFAGSDFWPAFDAFLARYGHRSSTREISAPRWVETPELVLTLVHALLAAPGSASPAQLQQRAQLRRLDAQEQALTASARGVGGVLRRAALSRLIALTQSYTQYRENQRFHLDYILLHTRQLVREAGRRLTVRGLLAEGDDVFFLEADEFRELMHGEESAPEPQRAHWRAVVDSRRAHWQRWRHRLPPLWLFDGVGVDPERETRAREGGADGSAWRGTAASRGYVHGRVRVVHSLAGLGQVQSGEILVAPNTDPGWTSVFPVLGGLITETGGMLSHGALLAREYSLPAVTGVSGATSMLVTGEQVELDGQAGTVRRI